MAMTHSRTLMLVVAHPDDDAYGLAGTVALHADDPHFRFVLVHATDGAAGDMAPGFPATRENLGSIRREECRRATFGPDGITGHPDHIAVGAATDEAFHRLRSSDSRGPRRLLHGAMRESTFHRWNAARAKEGDEPWDPTRVYHLRGVPDDQIGVEVDTSPVASRIVAGLNEHRSQRHVIYGQNRSNEQWERSVGRENMVIAWPPEKPGTTLLSDVFEGL